MDEEENEFFPKVRKQLTGPKRAFRTYARQPKGGKAKRTTLTLKLPRR